MFVWNENKIIYFKVQLPIRVLWGLEEHKKASYRLNRNEAFLCMNINIQ